MFLLFHSLPNVRTSYWYDRMKWHFLLSQTEKHAHTYRQKTTSIVWRAGCLRFFFLFLKIDIGAWVYIFVGHDIINKILTAYVTQTAHNKATLFKSCHNTTAHNNVISIVSQSVTSCKSIPGFQSLSLPLSLFATLCWCCSFSVNVIKMTLLLIGAHWDVIAIEHEWWMWGRE